MPTPGPCPVPQPNRMDTPPGLPQRSLLRESGALAIETALALLVVVPMVFWLLGVCMFTYTCSVLGDAARQGVRYAIVHGTDSSNCSGPSPGCADASGANVISIVRNSAVYSFHNLSGMTVEVDYPDASSSPSSRVQITVGYPYAPYIPLPGLARTIRMSAEGRIIY